MATKGKTDKELWKVLEGLDDDLLDLDLPEALVDEELSALGIDPVALANRASEFIAEAKEDNRLSWQVRAQERRAQLQARVSKTASRIRANMDRKAMLARMDELRAADSNVGSAIKMAARKRKEEESTDDELRVLLEQMEDLRAIEGEDPE
jgi:hypothetical protein